MWKPSVAFLIRNKNFKMSAAKNCHKLCTVLHKFYDQEPRIDQAEKTMSVRCVENESKISISTNINGKQRHYSREKHEPLKNTLARIHISLFRPNNKKKQKRKAQEDVGGQGLNLGHFEREPDQKNDVIIEVKRMQGCEQIKISEDSSNFEAFANGHVLTIGKEEFKIIVNAPAVSSVSLPNSLMAGFPIVPNLDLEFANRESSKFIWLRSKNSEASKKEMKNKKANQDEGCCTKNICWEFLSNKFMYTPSNQDIGYKLKFVCIPRRDDAIGFSNEAVSTVDVEAGPGVCPFDERHLYTSKPLDGINKFRVVSYNILADIYCASEYARTCLYPYCSTYATEFSYRGQLIMKELLGYNSDIICLQECDHKVFDNFLLPVLKDEGFEGNYKRKAGEMPEGEAIFYREAKFSLIEEFNVVINEAINLPCNELLHAALEKRPELLASLKKRTAVGQMLALRDATLNRAICILNTHLYFRPTASDIRLLQMMVLLNCLRDLVNRVKENHDNIDRVAVLICGDLNSTPDTAVVDLLLNNLIPSGHSVWKANNEHSLDIDLKQDFKLFSSCGFPKFTNYVAGFKATLDYILPDSDHFNVQNCVPLPEEPVLSLNVALPSIVIPSDHLALVCNLEWKE